MDKGEKEKRLGNLGNQPINKLIPSMAAPMIASSLMASVNNLVDTFFVSQISTAASGAVGIVFPLTILIHSIGITLAVGSTSYVSRLLGQGNQNRASESVSATFFTALFCSAMFTVLGSIFIEPMLKLFGATDTILPYAMDYARILLLGGPFIALAFVLNFNLRAEGNVLLSMIGVVTGAILNIILAPIFIFVLDFGIAGAAMATSISQMVNFTILCSHYIRGRSVLKLSLKLFRFEASMYKEIFRIGLSAFLRQILGVFSSILLNNFASAYGDAAIAAISISHRLVFFVAAVFLGICQGYQPVAGYNFGAKKFQRIREAFWFTYKMQLCFAVAAIAILFTFAPNIVSGFRPDPDVIAIGAFAVRAQILTAPFIAFAIVVTFSFQASGGGIASIVLNTCRQGWALIIVLLAMGTRFGIYGLIMAPVIADTVCVLIAFPMSKFFFRDLAAREEAAGLADTHM